MNRTEPQISLILFFCGLSIFHVMSVGKEVASENGFFAVYTLLAVFVGQLFSIIYPFSKSTSRMVDYSYYILGLLAAVFLFSQLESSRNNWGLQIASAEYDRAKIEYGFLCREYALQHEPKAAVVKYYNSWQPYSNSNPSELFEGLSPSDALCLASHMETQFPIFGPFGAEKTSFFVDAKEKNCKPIDAPDNFVPSKVNEFLVDGVSYECDLLWSLEVWRRYVSDREERWIFGCSNIIASASNLYEKLDEAISSSYVSSSWNRQWSVLAILQAAVYIAGEKPGYGLRENIPSKLHPGFDRLASEAAHYMHYWWRVKDGNSKVDPNVQTNYRLV